jgi:hypothetical protein
MLRRAQPFPETDGEDPRADPELDVGEGARELRQVLNHA